MTISSSFSLESGICVECYGVPDHAHIAGGGKYYNNWGTIFLYACFGHKFLEIEMSMLSQGS